MAPPPHFERFPAFPPVPPTGGAPTGSADIRPAFLGLLTEPAQTIALLENCAELFQAWRLGGGTGPFPVDRQMLSKTRTIRQSSRSKLPVKFHLSV